MRIARLIFVVMALGCSGGAGGSDPPSVDAAAAVDATATADAAPACTGVAYDECTANTQCASGNCHLFMQDGFQVCTQACDAANPCPQLGGEDGFCNNKGICKPPAKRTCTPQ